MPSGRSQFRFAISVILGTLAIQLSSGCGQQGVGQRCSTANLNRDCSAGLVCIPAEKLRNGGDDVPRCCPESGSSIAACRLGSNSSGVGDGGSTSTGGQSSLGGGGGLGGTSGLPLGSNCNYNSDCATNLVCGPQGVCQVECKEDRDCPDGKSCSDAKTCI